MTSQQIDAITSLLDACDEFVHAFVQDHPTKVLEVEQFASDLADWADSNPVPE